MKLSCLLLTAALLGCQSAKTAEPARAETTLASAFSQQRVDAPAFPAGLQWLNTDKPLTLEALRGKVVLLDFWTYCCINCIQTIPDLKKLEAKFPNELVVIGVHSAKFENEKEAKNIREAILRYEIEHPVANDKDFKFWNAYGVNAWPTLVLIAPDGKAVGMASGEGHLEVLDREITKLITEYDSKKALNRTPMKFPLERQKQAPSMLSFPGKIVADAKTQRLFFTDSNHNRVIISDLEGKVQEVIGDGKGGAKNGDFKTAQFFRPQGLCYDPAKNVLYVADTSNHLLRTIDLKTKRVSTLVGSGKKGGYPPRGGGSGREVSLSSPWDVNLVQGSLYVAMAGIHQIWKVNPTTGLANPYAGTGGENITDGPRATALLAQPSGITYNNNKLYFADSEVSAVRAVDLVRGEVSTLIGLGLFEFGDVDGERPQARLQHPIGIAYNNNYLYVADTYNHKIKRVNLKNNQLETFLGTGKRGFEDGKRETAVLNEPNGLTFVGDKIYIADTNNHQIRVYDMTKQILSTLKLTGIEKFATH